MDSSKNKCLMKEAGISQAGIARKLGISKEHVYKVNLWNSFHEKGS
jgi:DNA-binding XRE family transcriptional regulator